MVFYTVKKKKRPSFPFPLKFPYFRPKIRVFFKKKKGLHFHLLSNFPIFVQKSGCSLKKKGLLFALKSPYFRSKISVFFKKKVLSLLCH